MDQSPSDPVLPVAKVAIVNRDGGTVGWQEGETILDLDERPRGYILDGGVFDYLGRYRGAFVDGAFLDAAGAALARLQGTTTPLTSALDWETWFRGDETSEELCEPDRRG